MTAIDNARAARSLIDDRLAVTRLGRSLTREMDRDMLALKEAGAALDTLIAEHESLTAEMHQRELHHFEMEQIMTAAGIDPDAPTAPITDEMVEAAGRVMYSHWDEWEGDDQGQRALMRAALEAAEAAR